MKYAVDLHMHSCLSPCADADMTPNNIVNMSIIKGLDIIAITDHNSGENAKAIMECAEGTPLVVIPGMELETSEEVHVVCLFRSLENLINFQNLVYTVLPDMRNRPDIFGDQLILDKDDEVIGECDRMLITATDLIIDDVFGLVKKYGGVAYPAHIDRDSYSVLSNLGGIPESYRGRYLELSKNCDFTKFLINGNHFVENGYHFIRASDAHHLWDIYDRENFMELSEKSISAVLDKLNQDLIL